MLSIYLSSRGVALSRETYDQQYVEAANLRHNLALALLRVNEEADPSDSQSQLPFQRTTTSKASRKRRREQRVCVGSKRLRTTTGKLPVCSPTQAGTVQNSKRKPKSLTDADPTMQSIRTMFLGIGNKRRKKQKNTPPSKVAPAVQTFAD